MVHMLKVRILARTFKPRVCGQRPRVALVVYQVVAYGSIEHAEATSGLSD